MASRNIYYRISNTGFPSSDKKAQAGRYESDYNRIMRAISSATEGQARRLNYDVSTSGKGAGESSAIFSVPSQYQKIVDAVLTKTFQDITDSSSFSGQQNLLYSSRKTPFALELPFKKRALSAKAKAYYSASATEHNAYDIVRKADLIEGTIPVTTDTFDSSLVGEGGMYKGKKVTFTQFMKSKGMQREYIKNMFASGDRFNAEVVEKNRKLEEEKKQKELAKESEKKKKEGEKKEKEDKADRARRKKEIMRGLTLLVTGIALLKRILTTLVDFASDRQRKSVEGIGLGYTASDLERFNRFERRVSAQEGSVFDTAQSLMQIAGNPIAFSENQDRFNKLIRAFAFIGGKDSPNSIKLANDISKLANGSSEVTFDSIVNDMFGMLTTQWIANKKEGRDDLRQRISLLQDAGFNGLAELLGAFGVQYNESDKETKKKLENIKDLQGFIDFASHYVSENEGQWGANETFKRLQEAISALDKALKMDAIMAFEGAVNKFTYWIEKWLASREGNIAEQKRIKEESKRYENMSAMDAMEKAIQTNDPWEYRYAIEAIKRKESVTEEEMKLLPAFIHTMSYLAEKNKISLDVPSSGATEEDIFDLILGTSGNTDDKFEMFFGDLPDKYKENLKQQFAKEITNRIEEENNAVKKQTKKEVDEAFHTDEERKKAVQDTIDKLLFWRRWQNREENPIEVPLEEDWIYPTVDNAKLYEQRQAETEGSKHSLLIELKTDKGLVRLDPIELQSRNDTIDKIIMNQTDFGYTLEQVGYV